MAEEEKTSTEETPKTVGDALVAGEKLTELDALLDVSVDITAVLGTTMMPISQVLQLGRGAVVELNRGADEDIEIHANNRLIATGEVVVIEGRLGVSVNEVIRLPETFTG